MRISTINKNKYYILGVLFFLVLWSVLSLCFDSLIVPPPWVVFDRVLDILSGSYIYTCLFYTIARMLLGFVISFVLGALLGIVSGYDARFQYFLAPIMTILKTIPTASLVFFFLVLSGARFAPVYIVVLIALPILYESTVSGFENIDSSIKKALMIEKISVFRKIGRVELPMAFPYIQTGISSSFGLAFKIEIMAEILTGDTRNGLGSVIAYVQKSDPSNMTLLFAYSLIAILVSLMIDFICEKIHS